MVRSDVPRGVQAAQIAHAAGESSPGNLPNGTHVVVLTAPSEDALEAVSARLRARGIEHTRIIEPDAPYGAGDGIHGQLMALGCVPGRKEVIGRALSSLPLLR